MITLSRPLLLLAAQTVWGIAFVRGFVPLDWYTITPLPNGPALLTIFDSGIFSEVTAFITCVKGV